MQRLSRLLLGPEKDPRWARPALWLVLLLATFLNTWALSINQWANTYYSAAVLGMTQSWRAFFYGALDAGSFITVDKPPLALWVQALSARIFGFSTWSLLLPQAIAAVVTVWIVHHMVRRSFGHLAATIAALVLAVTPVAVALARHNNPDTLLVMLLSMALWAASNAIRSGRMVPLLASAVAVGLAFNTKMLQAYFVLPVIAVVYLLAARPRWPRKLLNLGAATIALLGVSFAWLSIVDFMPSGSRPYVGGSTDNTEWNLLLGYNGLGRIFGQDRIMSPGMTGGGAGMTGRSPGGMPTGGLPGGMPGFSGGRMGVGDGGWTRLLTGQVTPQIGWLYPLALLGTVAVIVYLWHRPRRDVQRADFLLWAGTLAVTALVFSFAAGIWHPYYTVALAAPLAAVTGMGTVSMLRLSRASEWWGLLLPAAIATTGFWTAHLLGQNEFLPWLAPVVVVVTLAAAIAMAVPLLLPLLRRRRHHRLIAIATAAGVLAALAAPTAYSLTTLYTPVAATFPAAGRSGSANGRSSRPANTRFSSMRTQYPDGPRQFSDPRGMRTGRGPETDDGFGARSGGVAVPVSDQLTAYLTAHHQGETWLVAVVGSMVAAPVILRTGQPVMAIGGYNGNDPAPTLGQLQNYVRDGQLRYVWTSGTSGVQAMGDAVNSTVVDASMAWVASHCHAVAPAEYGGESQGSTRLYDCRNAT